MRPYIAILPDDHRVIGPTEASVWEDAVDYRRDHPGLKGRIRMVPISVGFYNQYLANRHNPSWWLIWMQGGHKEWSSGKRQLINRLVRNIPKPRVQTRVIGGKTVSWNPHKIRMQTEADMPPKYPLAHLFKNRREVAE